MNKEDLRSGLCRRGVSEQILEDISEFLRKAEQYVFPKSFTREDATRRLKERMNAILLSEESEFCERLMQKYMVNVSPEFHYVEDGYDSCQPSREVSKIVSQLLCAGNLFQEARDYLGSVLMPSDVDSLLGIHLALTREELLMLGEIARSVGSKQDFLFPGITKSDQTVSDLETLALEVLLGNPRVSVRHLTGVGGLRFDRAWNYCLSFAAFTQKKVEEDKRFCPGSGMAHLLLQSDDLSDVPVLTELRSKRHGLFVELENLIRELKNGYMPVSNVSLIHSAYVPTSAEFAEARSRTAENVQSLQTCLGRAFHSPSYQYWYWKELGEILARKDYQKIPFILEELQHVDRLFTFNSPIHLPWCVELSSLTEEYIGKVTNRRGEYAIRYGVGLADVGTSVEIRFYKVKNRGGFWETSARLICYDDIFFTEERMSSWVGPLQDSTVREICSIGFLAFAIRLLCVQSGK